MSNFLEEHNGNLVKITDDYYISADQRNIILLKTYEKKLNKGRNAELSGELGLKEIGYFGSLNSLAENLVKQEVILAVSKVKELKDIHSHVENFVKVVQDTLKEKVTILQHNPKLKGDSDK